MTLIGVTGQTGAGKTTFCNKLRAVGFSVIDADICARKVVEKGSKCLEMLVSEFGDKILRKDGELNRRHMAKIVFGDAEKLALLNSIVHPFVISEIFKNIEILTKNSLVFVDAPTLFESEFYKRCDLIVALIVNDEEEQLMRLIKRDGITIGEAKSRIKSQKTKEFLLENADIVINNRNMEVIDNVIEGFKRKIAYK